MSESDYDQLREKSWRRELTRAEAAELRAWLAEHPESQGDWEAEVRLTQAVRRLQDAPVPGNFTARVVQAVERESAAEQRGNVRAWRWWSLRGLLPRVAVATAIFGAGLLTYHEHVAAERRAELVRGVKIVSGVPSLPSPEILQNFDTIQKMGASTRPDAELIALMK